MPIIVNLDVMMAKRKMSLNELSEKVGLTLSNLSILKTGKAKAIRFSTLEAICKTLDCQPGPSYPGRNKIKEASKAIQEGILSKDTHPVNPRAYLQISFNTFHAFSPTIFSPVAFG